MKQTPTLNSMLHLLDTNFDGVIDFKVRCVESVTEVS